VDWNAPVGSFCRLLASASAIETATGVCSSEGATRDRASVPQVWMRNLNSNRQSDDLGFCAPWLK
jgi:hypothetical protein